MKYHLFYIPNDSNDSDYEYEYFDLKCDAIKFIEENNINLLHCYLINGDLLDLERRVVEVEQ